MAQRKKEIMKFAKLMDAIIEESPTMLEKDALGIIMSISTTFSSVIKGLTLYNADEIQFRCARMAALLFLLYTKKGEPDELRQEVESAKEEDQETVN